MRKLFLPLFLILLLPLFTLFAKPGLAATNPPASTSTNNSTPKPVDLGQTCSWTIDNNNKDVKNWIYYCINGTCQETSQNGSTHVGTCQLTCYFCGDNSWKYDYYPAGNGNPNPKCVSRVDSSDTSNPIAQENCTIGNTCIQGCGCSGNTRCDIPQQPGTPLSLCKGGVCQTAVGVIPVDVQFLIPIIMGIALGIAGIVTVILIIISGYRMMISQGDPEGIKNAKDQLTAAIIGLLFLIFSLVILQVIGVNILGLPGFGK